MAHSETATKSMWIIPSIATRRWKLRTFASGRSLSILVQTSSLGSGVLILTVVLKVCECVPLTCHMLMETSHGNSLRKDAHRKNRLSIPMDFGAPKSLVVTPRFRNSGWCTGTPNFCIPLPKLLWKGQTHQKWDVRASTVLRVFRFTSFELCSFF